jgi:glycosyltransferase involved in cell wall biosynthesis
MAEPPSLESADRLRDARDWPEAAAAYAAWLEAHPDDWPIWVQHGHCVKEAGDPAAALAAYRRAEAGMPADPDIALQIGHALKLLGETSPARAAYARAVGLDPLNDEAWREWSRLADPADPVPEESAAGLWLDLSDLMAWFAHARAPSGIQRVQTGLARAALAGTAGLAAARIVIFRPDAGVWRGLPAPAFRRLAALAEAGADPEEPRWRETLEAAQAMLDATPALEPPPGAWLVNPGSSWWLDGYHRAVAAAREAAGLRYAALVHDVGPLILPEHSPPALAASFAAWIAELAAEAELLLAVSASTRIELDRLGPALAPFVLPPVALLRPDVAPPSPPEAAPHPRAAELAGQPFALFVATIESRKDHLFVLNAWLGLLRRHGARLPLLVLAGRAGFEAAPVLALLRRAPALAGRVIWLDDADDAALAALRREALFCLYNSRHEGWGLPVTEALAAGKAVIAPAHSGLIEAGQGLALHFRPGSEPEFAALVERLAFDAAFRAEAEARIAAGRRLRDWGAVAADLAAALAAAPMRRPAPAAPPLGLTHRLGLNAEPFPGPALAWAAALRQGPGWHPPEPGCCRTRPGEAVLRLALPPDAAFPLRLHLALRGAETPRRVTLRLGRRPAQILAVEAGALKVAVLDLPAPVAAARLTIATEPPEAETTGIGVVALMACPPGDVAARLDFLERLSFVWPDLA